MTLCTAMRFGDFSKNISKPLDRMSSNSHYIFRWIPLSVIGYKFILCALIMERYAILIDIL